MNPSFAHPRPDRLLTIRQSNRRAFLRAVVAAAGLPGLVIQAQIRAIQDTDKTLLTTRGDYMKIPLPEVEPIPTGSDVGSLFPFIESQSKSDHQLSFLNSHFNDLQLWKRVAREKLLELLQYSPLPC